MVVWSSKGKEMCVEGEVLASLLIDGVILHANQLLLISAFRCAERENGLSQLTAS
jgi:hypothetical protein